MLTRLIVGLCVSVFLAAPISAQQGSSLDSLRSDVLEKAVNNYKITTLACSFPLQFYKIPEVRLSLQYEYPYLPEFHEPQLSGREGKLYFTELYYVDQIQELTRRPISEFRELQDWRNQEWARISAEYNAAINNRDWEFFRQRLMGGDIILGLRSIDDM